MPSLKVSVRVRPFTNKEKSESNIKCIIEMKEQTTCKYFRFRKNN